MIVNYHTGNAAGVKPSANLADMWKRASHEETTSPIIRACLESARDDIVHLVGRGQDADQMKTDESLVPSS